MLQQFIPIFFLKSLTNALHLITYIIMRFYFHQSQEHIGIGYKAHHKNIYMIEDNQYSHNKPACHQHKYG